jgi:hypothetical protein
MKTQRLRIAALVLLAALCASACSAPPQQAENVPPVETNSAASTPRPAGREAAAPAPQRDDGDAFTPANVELATKQPFLVLIRKNDCAYCDRLSVAMRELSKVEPRMLFFVLNIDDPRVGENDKKVVDENAKSINVGLTDSRKSNPPYAAVFGAGGKTPKSQFEVSGEKGDDAGHNAAVAVLRDAVADARGGGGAGKEEMNALVKGEVARQLGELKQGLAKDPDFQKSLLEDEAFRARVKSVVLADDAFRGAVAAGLAGDAEFQKKVKSGPVDTKTVMAYAALGLFPLLALGLGAWNFRELRRKHPYARRRRRVFSKALKSGKGLIGKLRSDVDSIEARVGEVEKAAQTPGGGETKPAPDDEVRQAVLVMLNDVVGEAAGPTRSGEADLKTKEAGLHLWNLIDGNVGKLRLELNPRIETLEAGLNSHVESPHGAGGLTAKEVEDKIDSACLHLMKKIDKGDLELSNEIEKVRDELLGKIESGTAGFRNAPGAGLGGQTGGSKENGRGGQGAGIQAGVAVAPPQGDAQAARTGASGTERPGEKTPGPPAETEPGGIREQVGTLGALELRVAKLEETSVTPQDVAELKGELVGLRGQLKTAGQEGWRALETRVESVERRLRKSRVQMSKLLNRLRKMLKGISSQASNSLRELRTQLTQQGEGGEAARQALEQRLQDLREDGELAHLELTDVTKATSKTVAEIVRRLLDAHEAKMAAGLPADEEGRAESARALEWQRKQLHETAAEVAPLVGAMTELTELAASTPKLPPEIKSKLAGFLDDAAKFGRLEGAAGARLEALHSNSARSLYEKFRGEREELERRLASGDASADGFANDGLKLLDGYAAGAADDGASAASSVSGEELKAWASGADERLMDWYSDFFQLHTRLQEARRAGGAIDDAVFQGVGGALKVAREVLSRFDIQPKEIVIGQTLYDGRLHDFTEMRQSSHPTQTIVEVLKSGFHRMRDGETLRRPKVVVAGTGSASGAA